MENFRVNKIPVNFWLVLIYPPLINGYVKKTSLNLFPALIFKITLRLNQKWYYLWQIHNYLSCFILVTTILLLLNGVPKNDVIRLSIRFRSLHRLSHSHYFCPFHHLLILLVFLLNYLCKLQLSDTVHLFFFCFISIFLTKSC